MKNELMLLEAGPGGIWYPLRKADSDKYLNSAFLGCPTMADCDYIQFTLNRKSYRLIKATVATLYGITPCADTVIVHSDDPYFYAVFLPNDVTLTFSNREELSLWLQANHKEFTQKAGVVARYQTVQCKFEERTIVTVILES